MLRLAAVGIAAFLCACCAGGPLAPGCDRETGTVFEAGATVRAGGTSTFEVTSPRHSNLIMVIAWPDPSATLALRATMIACGEHEGCQVGLVTPAVPAIPPVPGTLRLLVDGTRGKRYAVDVLGDTTREQSFTLRVTFDTGICT